MLKERYMNERSKISRRIAKVVEDQRYSMEVTRSSEGLSEYVIMFPKKPNYRLLVGVSMHRRVFHGVLVGEDWVPTFFLDPKVAETIYHLADEIYQTERLESELSVANGFLGEEK